MSIDEIFDLMGKGVQENVFPGAVLLVARDNKIIFNEPFGLADIYTKQPIKTDSIFDLASLTKPLATAICVLRLIENKSIRIEQPIGSILKSFQSTAKSDITIDMLLRHTSGLPAYKEYFSKIVLRKNNPKKYLRQLIAKENLEYTPGSKQVYSDIGYMILSWVIEKISEQKFDQVVNEMVFAPLGIDTLFFIEHVKENKNLQAYRQKLVSTQDCPWRKRVLTGEVDDDNAWAVGGVDGHAGLFGDAAGVYRICDDILSGLLNQPTKLVNSKILNQFVIRKDGLDMVAGFDTPSKLKSSAGQFFSSSSVGHLGFTGTSFWIDPKSALIVILLTNRVHPSRSNEKIKQFRPRLHDLIYSTLM